MLIEDVTRVLVRIIDLHTSRRHGRRRRPRLTHGVELTLGNSSWRIARGFDAYPLQVSRS